MLVPLDLLAQSEFGGAMRLVPGRDLPCPKVEKSRQLQPSRLAFPMCHITNAFI